MTKTISINQFRVKIYDTRAEMGFCAADEAAAAIRGVLAQKEECNMIFAAAPSQNEMLAALAAQPGIEWNRVNAFHMDEYIGLAPDAPQGFANFLRAAIFTKVPFDPLTAWMGPRRPGIRQPSVPAIPNCCAVSPWTSPAWASGKTGTSPSTTPPWPISTTPPW